MNEQDNPTLDAPKELSVQKNQKKAYFKISDFPKMAIFEERYSEIKDELNALIRDSSKFDLMFETWCEKDLFEESNPDGWKVCPLMINGAPVIKNLDRVPALKGILSCVKGIVTASFSCLKPGTWIVPHRGYENYADKILRFHLGLIIPKGDAGLRVSKIQTKWTEGKALIFDDSQTHEAWNYTEEDRYVLIIDFLRHESMDVKSIEIQDLLLTEQAQFFVDSKK